MKKYIIQDKTIQFITKATFGPFFNSDKLDDIAPGLYKKLNKLYKEFNKKLGKSYNFIIDPRRTYQIGCKIFSKLTPSEIEAVVNYYEDADVEEWYTYEYYNLKRQLKELESLSSVQYWFYITKTKLLLKWDLCKNKQQWDDISLEDLLS